MIRIKLNGEFREVKTGANLLVLLDELNLPQDGIAVAVNDRVIPRKDYLETQLQDSDQVEIIHAVGGGKTNKTFHDTRDTR